MKSRRTIWRLDSDFFQRARGPLLPQNVLELNPNKFAKLKTTKIYVAPKLPKALLHTPIHYPFLNFKIIALQTPISKQSTHNTQGVS